jgi:hypothetical protein
MYSIRVQKNNEVMQVALEGLTSCLTILYYFNWINITVSIRFKLILMSSYIEIKLQGA